MNEAAAAVDRRERKTIYKRCGREQSSQTQEMREMLQNNLLYFYCISTHSEGRKAGLLQALAALTTSSIYFSSIPLPVSSKPHDHAVKRD